MMQRHRAQHQVAWFGCTPFQNVSFDKSDFWIMSAQLFRDLKRRRLSIQRVDVKVRANFASVLGDQARDIARAGRKIENAHARTGFYPTAQEHRNQRVTAKPAIELANVFEIALQFGRDRLRSVHQFELSWMEAPLHQSTVVAVYDRCINSSDVHTRAAIAIKIFVKTRAARPFRFRWRCGLRNPAETWCSCRKP